MTGRGVNSRIAEKTGYTLSMVGRILSGKAELGDRFVRMVCTEFGIKEEWVISGKRPILVNPMPEDNWNGQPTMTPEGERLKLFRELSGYSFSEMSELLGIDIDALQRYENELFLTDMRLLRKLPLIGINLNWLTTGLGSMWLKVWPIIVNKHTNDSRERNQIEAAYKIDDLFTTRLKQVLGSKSTEWLSNETNIDLQKIERIISGDKIPSVDELEAIAYALGRINPRWLAQESKSLKEDWEFELFRDATAEELPYWIFNLCEVEVNNYLEKFRDLVRLTPDNRIRVIGALGRLHLKNTHKNCDINREMLKVLIEKVAN